MPVLYNCFQGKEWLSLLIGIFKMLRFGVVLDHSYSEPIFCATKDQAAEKAKLAPNAILIVGDITKNDYLPISYFDAGVEKDLGTLFSSGYDNFEHSVVISNWETGQITSAERYDNKSDAYDARAITDKLLTSLGKREEYQIDLVISQFNIVVS